MKFIIQSTFIAGVVLASPHTNVKKQELAWAPAGPNDMRGPCPMMNTLANHGFIPRDGGGITRQVAIDGLAAGLNFGPDLASIMFDQAIIINPEPNATFFTLDMLNKHNILEHDASLSRSDAYFGNNHVFNQTVFDTIKPYFTADILTPTMLTNAKLFRQIQSRATNPTYRFTASVENFSIGEVSAPTIAFGNLTTGDVNRTLVEFFFENEKLPSELGWVKKSEPVTLETILAVTSMFSNASSLLTVDTDGTSTASVVKMRRVSDLHTVLS